MQMSTPVDSITQRFNDALDSFIEKVEPDPNVLAVVLAGSLAYDVVWEKSDMDLTVVLRDQRLETRSYCVDEDNLILNVGLMTRTEFKQMLGQVRGGDMAHSMFARARIVYTRDESLREYLHDIQRMGADDIERSFFTYTSFLIGDMEKVEKWLAVKHNPQYAQYYLIRAADTLATLYLIEKGIAPNRESILRVQKTDPDFIRPFYDRALQGPMTEEEILAALAAMNQYLIDRAELISRPVIRYMEDGEIKPVTLLVKQFGLNSHGIYHVFDFLTEQGYLDKVTQTIRITPKGRKTVEEVAFIYTKNLY